MKKPNSIILLSGGLDSTVSAAIATRKTKPLFALTFDYGQRAAIMEIKASRKICQILKIKHKIISLPFFKDFKGLRMCNAGKKLKPAHFRTLDQVWIPNRNGLFINIAACYAEHYNASFIVTGFNREEAMEFPDNSIRYIAAVNHSLFYSTRNRVKVISFVADYSKSQIYRIGIKYRAPLKLIYSCYLGGKETCGQCASCRRLLNASSGLEK
ncbi:7-cyano-7-deazaguanine synthase QueC [candidate division WOR-3 bacterium RBG_13_43_14]|uniref:7-cyano-7-deazaguanine synthase n=1 Tax=candidate division WOR-3 bacterium RBG_13_43_14 TaxID=1802590 RepID=A0A1F4U2N0_UNCW3|nr:MAG: 7-cyano-7-deazaguanine synthase QueC [candidate division WOR-3 bacterium RBG_13_43_14]